MLYQQNSSMDDTKLPCKILILKYTCKHVTQAAQVGSDLINVSR